MPEVRFSKDALELVARLMYRQRTGRNMPDRRPLDPGETTALERHRQYALQQLREQANAIDLTVIEDER